MRVMKEIRNQKSNYKSLISRIKRIQSAKSAVRYYSFSFLLFAFCFLLLSGCEEQAAQSTRIDNSWPNQPLWTANIGQRTEDSGQALNAERQTLNADSAPRLTFEKVVHNFGNVSPGSANTYLFSFKNTGNTTLKITDVNSTCGCTVSKLLKNEYAPGETGQLAVGYLAQNQFGETSMPLHVYSNDPANPIITLSVKSKIVTLVDFEPKNLNLMLLKQNGDCPEIKIKSLDGTPFAITSFQSTANCIDADFYSTEKATEFILKPKVDMNILESISRGNFEIGTSHPDCKVISGTFSAPARFSASPKSITIYQAASGTSNKKVSVLSNYNESFEIVSATSRDGIVKVNNTTKTSKGYDLDIQINTSGNSKSKGFTDLLTLKLTGGRTIEIPCNGVLSADEAAAKTNETDDGECKTCKGPLIVNPGSSSIIKRNGETTW
jgi:hypothetical protein